MNAMRAIYDCLAFSILMREDDRIGMIVRHYDREDEARVLVAYNPLAPKEQEGREGLPPSSSVLMVP